jgi:hypothetical protein
MGNTSIPEPLPHFLLQFWISGRDSS